MNTQSEVARLSSENGASSLKLNTRLAVGGNTKEELLEKLKTANYRVGGSEKVGIQVGDRAHEIAGKPECTFPIEKEEGVEFVKGAIIDLFGFVRLTETQVFLNEAFLAERDLEFCMPSDAFYFRLDYTCQPFGEGARMGMKPIAVSGSDPSVFYLVHRGGGLWLLTDDARPRIQAGPYHHWIFRRRKVTRH